MKEDIIIIDDYTKVPDHLHEAVKEWYKRYRHLFFTKGVPETKMIQPLTEKEKERIKAFHEKTNMNDIQIAADLTVGRNLLTFIQLQGQVEAYLKEEER